MNHCPNQSPAGEHLTLVVSLLLILEAIQSERKLFQRSIIKTCCSSEDKFITEDTMNMTIYLNMDVVLFGSCGHVIMVTPRVDPPQSEGQVCRNRDRLRIE